MGGVTVAPAALLFNVVVYLKLKADSAVFGAEHRLALMKLSVCVLGGKSVEKNTLRCELIVVCFENCRVLLIIVYVKYVCYYVIVTACIYAGTGGIKQLCLLVGYTDKLVVLTLESPRSR